METWEPKDLEGCMGRDRPLPGGCAGVLRFCHVKSIVVRKEASIGETWRVGVLAKHGAERGRPPFWPCRGQEELCSPLGCSFSVSVLLRGAVANPGFGSEPISFHQWSSKRFAREHWFQGSGHPKQLARCQRTDFATAASSQGWKTCLHVRKK